MYKEQLDMTRIPCHVAIIMDGNGRWAKQRGLPRNMGHQQGVEAVKRVTEMCVSLGVKYLTLYTFSTENWNRPDDEVSALMGLVLSSLEEEIFMKNNVRFNMIGDASRLPANVLERIRQTEEHTAKNNAMTMTIAMSYSSRWELTEATRKAVRAALAGELQAGEITEETISQFLATADMPDPDLLIRTGGELRISNYLLWQCAYSEFYFCATYWPDFDGEALCKAILDFQSRERRYGKTSEQIQDNHEQQAE
jgi:undecaprenyl diphosphate synthase